MLRKKFTPERKKLWSLQLWSQFAPKKKKENFDSTFKKYMSKWNKY